MKSSTKILKIVFAIFLGLVAITAGNQSYAQGTWETKAPMPTARWSAIAGVIDGKLYVAGGLNGTNSLSTLEVYDPVSDTWATKAPMPTARNDAGGGVIDGKLYVVGGVNQQKLTTLEVYDPVTDTWSTKTQMPTPRSSPGTAVINGKLYVAGGCMGWCAPVTNALEVYDPATNTWATKASMLTGRGNADVAVVNGLFYVMGGCCGWTSPESDLMARTVELYDPTANTWIAKAQHLVGAGDTAEAIDGKIYVAKSDALEVYDPANDSWISLSPMHSSRYYAASGLINGKLYVVGGYDGILGVDTLEVYTPDRDFDQVNDALDAFPNDPAASKDTDGDGYPDEWNASASAEMIAASTLVLDAFPNDPAASKDTDGDGYLDEWNASASAEMIAASTLVLDAFPNDPNQWLPETNLPDKPVLISPTRPGILDTLKPILRVGSFSDPNDQTHFMTRWQLSAYGTDFDFEDDMVFDLESETSLISLQIPDLILESNQTYYWRARFINQNQYESPWSEIYSFSTPENSNDPDGNGIEEEFKITTPVDLDRNGVDDNLQTDIKSVKTSVGDAQVGIKMATGVIAVEQVKPISPEELPDEGKPLNLPYGLVSFRLNVTPGADAEVYVYFSKALPPGMKWYKYDSANGWYDFSSNAVFNDALTAVTLRLTDGGVGDADGVANGIIVDPSGPGTDSISSGGSGRGDGGGSSSCFISVATNKPVQGQSFIIGLFAFSIVAFWGWTFRRKRN